MNGGVAIVRPGAFATTDYAVHDKRRPVYWDEQVAGDLVDFSFGRLATEPITALRELVDRFDHWTQTMWSDDELRRREDGQREPSAHGALPVSRPIRGPKRRHRSASGCDQTRELFG